jgi:hypothetical protein
LGLLESFLGLPVGFLINDITYYVNPQEAQKASGKPPGSYKKFQGRNLDNIFCCYFGPNDDTKKAF